MGVGKAEYGTQEIRKVKTVFKLGTQESGKGM
jgi:hypothetical protein